MKQPWNNRIWTRKKEKKKQINKAKKIIKATKRQEYNMDK